MTSLIIPFKIENADFITLTQLLKATDCVNSGGDAQQLIVAGKVIYNGAVDYRKRLKVRVGDVIKVENKIIQVS